MFQGIKKIPCEKSRKEFYFYSTLMNRGKDAHSHFLSTWYRKTFRVSFQILFTSSAKMKWRCTIPQSSHRHRKISSPLVCSCMDSPRFFFVNRPADLYPVHHRPYVDSVRNRNRGDSFRWITCRRANGDMHPRNKATPRHWVPGTLLTSYRNDPALPIPW